MSAEILSIETAALFEKAVARAVALLKAGHVVALPTETVYGLAANALDATAVARIYEIKNRPPENPIIVHVAGIEMARRCASEWPPLADKLTAAFWPGPLTLVLPRSKEIPPIVTAGGPTVGLRWPSHPFIQAVIRGCGFPLAAPSANPANALSPTNARHVEKSLAGKIQLIVDGGQSQVGIESSVLDLSCSPPRLLRPGMISVESLGGIIGATGLISGTESSKVLRSPGMLPRHYSPKARLVILSWRDDADLAKKTANFNVPRAKIHVVAHTQIPQWEDFGRVAVIPHDAQAYARAIYAELHACDEEGAELIIVEELPPTEEWSGIADRLRRASQPGSSG